MKKFTEVMKALSDPNRVKILKILQHRSMCVCELREALQVSQPTVSKHLKVLERAGLVNSKKDGLWVDYFLADGSESPYAGSLLGNLRHWMEKNGKSRQKKGMKPWKLKYWGRDALNVKKLKSG